MAAIDGWEPFLGEDRALTLTSDGEADATLEAVAEGLSSAGFKIKDRSADGFEASWLDKWELVPPDLSIKRTKLGVSGVSAPSGGAQVVVRVLAGEMHKRGAARAGQGLTAAYDALEDQGRRVAASGWDPVPS